MQKPWYINSTDLFGQCIFDHFILLFSTTLFVRVVFSWLFSWQNSCFSLATGYGLILFILVFNFCRAARYMGMGVI